MQPEKPLAKVCAEGKVAETVMAADWGNGAVGHEFS